MFTCVRRIKKTYRIYNEIGLQLRNKTLKRRVKAKLRDDRTESIGVNDVWAMDFVHDPFADQVNAKQSPTGNWQRGANCEF